MQPGAQLALVDRLAEKIVRARLEAERQIVHALARREQYQVDIVLLKTRADLLAERQAVHYRHLPVAQHHVHPLRRQHLQRRNAVNGFQHLIAPFSQHAAEQPSVHGGVINNQNPLSVRHQSSLKR
ncbi:hypothetical protein BN136_520 [Cronobacter universalis NCTC 9529]|nr:hypothetical protein BN136_520 [Cronobacter universalis NCTC 9529]